MTHHFVKKLNVDITDAMPLEVIRERKVFGETAIPAGTYHVRMMHSVKFDAPRAYLLSVPGFTKIMLHEGNTRHDTLGCILVGMNTKVGVLTKSRKSLEYINSEIAKDQTKGAPVILTIRSSLFPIPGVPR